MTFFRVFFSPPSPGSEQSLGVDPFFSLDGSRSGRGCVTASLLLSPAEQNVTAGFCGTAATNSCGPPGGQRCRCCSHKVTLMSRNREKHMCPDLEAPFQFSTSFACAAANNEPEAVRGWGRRWLGGMEGGRHGRLSYSYCCNLSHINSIPSFLTSSH